MLDEPPNSGPDQDAPTQDGISVPFSPPVKLPGLPPRYVDLRQIGAGGMGIVYRARDTETGETIALKILRPEIASDAEAMERFKNELRLARRITHRNVCRIYEFHRLETMAYISMECVEGESLRTLLRRGGTLETVRCIDIANQVCEALTEAHRQGVVHRDLKPENMMVDRQGQVKLMDFGIARTFTAGTTTTVIVGTPSYMSPEQADGKHVDHRADIYSFGLVLYEMFTGRQAVAGDGLMEVLRKQIRETPPPPHEIQANIPEHIEQAIMKCIAKDPAQRFPSAQALRQALLNPMPRSLVSQAPPQINSPEGSEMLAQVFSPGKFSPLPRSAVRRGGILGFLTLIVTAALIVASVAKLRDFHASGLPEQKNLVVLPFKPMSVGAASGSAEDRLFCDALTEAVTDMLARVPSLQVLPAGMVRDRGATTIDKARTELGGTLALSGEWKRVGPQAKMELVLIDTRTSSVLRRATLLESTTDLFVFQYKIVTAVRNMLGIEGLSAEAARAAAGAEDVEAYNDYVRGRAFLQSSQKLEMVENALNLFLKSVRRDPNFALGHAGVGEAYVQKYRLINKGSLLDDALGACQSAAVLRDDLSAAHACLGAIYTCRGEYDRAVSQLQQAVHLDIANDDAYLALAEAFENQQKPAEAETTYRQAIELRKRYWRGYSWLGAFYAHRHRYPEAGAMFSQVVALAPDNAYGYFNLGGVLLLQNRYGEAIDALQRSIAIRATEEAYSNLGSVFLSRRSYPQAVRAYEQALKLDDHEYVVWGNLGEANYWIPEKKAEAKRAFTAAAAKAEQQRAINPKNRRILLDLAHYNAMIDNRKTALDQLNKSLPFEKDDSSSHITAAKIYQHFGNSEAALKHLEMAMGAGAEAADITDAPDFDSLRNLPRFQQLLRKPRN